MPDEDLRKPMAAENVTLLEPKLEDGIMQPVDSPIRTTEPKATDQKLGKSVKFKSELDNLYT